MKQMTEKYQCIACSIEKEPHHVSPVKEMKLGREWLTCPDCGSIELEEVECQ